MFGAIIKYGRFVRKSRQGRVSLLSANICETEQQKQRTEKGQKFTLLQWNSHQRQRDRKNTPAVTDGGSPATEERGQHSGAGWE